MAKRIILISSFPLLVAIAIIAIVLAGIGRGQPAATPADIEQSKSQIISLVEAGKLAEADAAVDKIMALPTNRDKGAALQQIAWTYRNARQADPDKAITISDYVLKNWPKESFAVWAGMSMAISQIDKGNTADAEAITSRMIADYADNTDLAGALCVIADTYSWRRMYDRANRLYRLVIDKSADSSSVVKSHLGLARVEILELIGEKKFSLAQEKLDSMIVDFNDEPNLPTALFQAGQEFCWQHQYSESKDVFDHIKNLPDNSFTQQAKLWSARVNVCSLIGHAKDEDIIAGIDKLIKDFEGDAGLPEAVQWIGREYEWTKGAVAIEDRTGWYDTPNSVYQKLMQQFSSTSYGRQAEWDQKRLTHRMTIFKLIQEPNQAATDAAIETMVAEFKGRPEVAGELRWVAWGYGEQPDKGPQAKQIYERIIREYPGTVEANETALDIRRLDIWEKLKAGEVNEAEILMDKFVADFNQHPYAGDCSYQLAEECYLAGREFGKDEFFHASAGLFEEIRGQLGAVGVENANFAAGVHYMLGLNRQQLGDYAKAANAFENAIEIETNPNHEYAGNMPWLWLLIADCYEKLKAAGDVNAPEADIAIETAYQNVVTNYTNGGNLDYALMRLGKINMEKHKYATACAYFQRFLVAADGNDPRIADVNSIVERYRSATDE